MAVPWFEYCPVVTVPLALQVTAVRRQSHFTIAIRQVAGYGVGRVYLAGDAAHCHSPAGGRGMNLGIADAADLAARITDDRLDGYSAARHEDGARTIAQSERIRRRVTTTSGTTRVLTKAAFYMIGSLPPLQRWVARRFLDN